jgi:epoxyqueuosine reductase
MFVRRIEANVKTKGLQARIWSLAEEEGFSGAGMAAVPEVGSAEDLRDRERFESWVRAGRAGTMEYLKRRNEAGRLVRSSMREAVPWVRSVIVCMLNYNSDAPYSTDAAPKDAGWIARYAWTGSGGKPTDYHKVLLGRLERLRERLAVEFGEFEARCYVDTGPLVERVYAQYAGLGWVGKNTCVLNQELGSWLFLGVILTSLEMPAGEAALAAADRCGSCTRCIDACPTGALVASREMDASRCISYLTIEHRGSIAEDLREGMGRQVFGCDICQDVCPWNGRRRAPLGREPDLAVRVELVNPALDWLAGMDEAAFGEWFYGSPVKRAKFGGFRRNVAIAMGNSGDPRCLPQLREWAAGEDAVLAEASRWAEARLESAQVNAGIGKRNADPSGLPDL